MNIINFFQFSNQNHTLDDLCDNLQKQGINASSFNIVSWRYNNQNKKQRILWISIVSILAQIPRVRGLMTKLFQEKALLKLSEKFSHIDIHFFSPVYDELIKEFKKRGKNVKITIWGSDFYRVNSQRHEQQRKIYEIVDIIQIETQQIANDFLKVYPEFKDKIRLAHFGIIQFDIIDELLKKENPAFYKREFKIPFDKIVLTCGTNRSDGHQHLKILETIEKLAPEIRDRLFLIFPMTYGGSKSYMEIVRKKAESMGLPFILLSSFLSLEDLSRYRIVSDITLTIQKTDALASAIQEHLYTEEILIAGEWLPYHVLKDLGVYFQTTAIDEISEIITDTVQNIELIQTKCSGNKDILAKFSAWNFVIKDWVNNYTEIRG